MKLVTTITMLALAAAAAALPCVAANAAISLDIAPVAMVAGPQVTLADVAVVRCADAAAVAKLKGITVASAPMPGKTRTLDMQYVKARLRQHGFDPDAMKAVWPEKVLITTRSVTVAGPELMAAGEAALRALAPADASELVVTCARAPADLVLSEGAVELKAEVLGSATGGSRLVKVTAWVDGRPQASQTICYRLQRFAEVVTAAGPIERGAIIGAGDVTVARCELSGGDPGLSDPTQAVGLRARRTLRAGEVLSRAVVEQPPVIQRGQKVWVSARCGAICVRAEAIACADAVAGGTVRMKNQSSGETFLARVDAEGRVYVAPQ